MEYYSTTSATTDWRNAVIVLPLIGHANIGELALDVLISCFNAQLVGRLDHPALLPAAGNDPWNVDNPGTLATGLELYQVPGVPLFLMQQRAPAAAGLQGMYATDLLQWLQAAAFGRVAVLCSASAQLLRDAQLDELNGRIRHLPLGGAPDAPHSPAGLPPLLEAELMSEDRSLHPLLPPWPLMDVLGEMTAAGSDSPATPAGVLLLCFASEGDNVQDAVKLGATCLGWLAAQSSCEGLPVEQLLAALQVGAWRRPSSWAGLYGRDADQLMFAR